MTLRCTRKLLKALHVPDVAANTPATNVLGDWYANVYDATPQPIILCLNERSLLAALLVLRDLESARTEIPKAVGRVLRSVGVPEDAIRAELAAMSEIRFGRTANRRILGSLNECAFGLSTQLDCMYEQYLGEHEMFMASFTYSATEYRSPHALARELFEAADPGPRRSVARIH